MPDSVVYYQLEIDRAGKLSTKSYRDRRAVIRAFQEAIRVGAKASVWMYDDENPRELVARYGGQDDLRIR
jgi:hypothetical protein